MILALALFPSVLVWLSGKLGVGVPSYMVFFAACVVLLFVALQLSLEVGRLEHESQRLAEEVALLREEFNRPAAADDDSAEADG